MVKMTTLKIELPAKKKAEIAKLFGVTTQNVSQALLFRRNSPNAIKIRKAAMNNGGTLVKIIDVTDELKNAVKELNAKGEVIRTIKE